MKSKRARRGPAWGKIIVAVVVLAALAAAWRYTPLSEFVTAKRISAWARAVGETPWAPIAFVFAYTPAAFVMFPRPLLTLFGVVAFGPWLGFAYSMTGIVGSALATYYVGRTMSRETVKDIAGEKLDGMSRKVRRHGLAAVFAIRMVPAAPFGVEGIMAGAVRISVWQYTLGTVLGMAPGVLAMTVFGTQITQALEDPSTINWWIVGATLLAFFALTYALSRWFANKA
jgi:uncharacterized membrane protein YdjX (TVP38/TMEM64 family)